MSTLATDPSQRDLRDASFDVELDAVDELALQLRHQAAVKAADREDVAGRWDLLAAVVAPGDTFAEATRELARGLLEGG